MERFPILYTKRLKLRKMEIEDLPSLVKHANDKSVSENIINIPYPYREPDAAFRMSYVVQGFKSKTRFVFAITEKSIDQLIGEISLNIDKVQNIAELGFWIGAPSRNKGFTTEAINAILKFGFENLDLVEIFGSTMEGNQASSRVMKKCGMKLIRNQGSALVFSYKKEDFQQEDI